MRIGYRALLILAMVLLLWASFAWAAGNRVLILHSYHEGFRWTDSVQRGMLHGLRRELGGDVDMSVEYMDTKRFAPADIGPELLRLYSMKYRSSQPDVILSSDDNALRFLIDHGQKLFPDVPVVFCGVNNYDPRMLRGRTNITGVREAFDIAGNIELIHRLHPKAPTVAVVSDSTPTGAINLERFQKIAPAFSGRLKFTELSGLSTAELTQRLKTLPEGSVLLFLAFFRDSEGKAYSVKESAATLLAARDLPIYVMWDFMLDTGVVGGKVVSGDKQGDAAARMAAAILKGADVDRIPVLLESPNVFMFDYGPLNRYSISEDSLPLGSVILNKPSSFYYRNKLVIWVLSGALGLLCVLLVFMGFNILQRRKVEAALLLSQQQYSLVVKGANDGVWDWNVDTNEVFYSTRYREMLGYSNDEEFGTDTDAWVARLHPDDMERVFEANDSVRIKGGELFSVEFRMRHKDGHYVWILGRGTGQRDESGRVVRMTGTHTDISDWRQAEEDLANMNRHLEELVLARTQDLDLKARELEHANARLQELDRMKSAFLSSVSHELRTPLTSVLGFAKLILKDVDKVLGAKDADIAVERLRGSGSRMRDNLEIIIHEGERLTRLINDVLDLDRIEKGRIQWKDQPTDIAQVAQNAADAVRGVVEAKPDLTLQVDIQGKVPWLCVDPDRMHQLVLNLLSNAVKFTDKGEVSLACLAENERVLLSVSDTGQGIPTSELDAVFDKFYQVRLEDTVRTSSRGTGLGLAICRNIVRHYDGVIWAESEEGKGSTFHVALPSSLYVDAVHCPVPEQSVGGPDDEDVSPD